MDLIIHNTVLFITVATFFYSAAFFYSLYHLILHTTESKITFYGLLIVGFLCQGIALYYRGIVLGSFPLSNTLELLQVISWSAVFLIILFQIAFRLRLLAFFGSGFVSIIGITSLIFYSTESTLPVVNILQNPWIEFHAVLATFAYGAFGLLAVTSLMYLLQDYSLSHKHFGGFYSLLPSLRQLSEINQRLLLIGLVALGIAIGVGTLSWLSDDGEVNLFKIFATWGLLICYFVLYFIKHKKFVSLRKSAWSSLFLFIMAMLSLWPVQY